MKYLFIISFLILSVFKTQAQISDQEFVAFTASLDQIMRIKVESGGDINFVFNTISQMKNGINNAPQYDTKFNVTSSVNFHVLMYAQDNALVGVGSAAVPMNLNNIEYTVDYTGAGAPANYTLIAGTNPLTGPGAPATIIDNAANNYGNNAINKFTINWECGNGPQTILEQSIREDMYITNVVLQLEQD